MIDIIWRAYHIEKQNPSFEAPTLDGAIQIRNFPTLFTHFEHIATKELVRLGKTLDVNDEVTFWNNSFLVRKRYMHIKAMRI